MSTSQSIIFRKLSKNRIAQSSRIALCSKIKKGGFLASIAQWTTNPNSASSSTHQSIPSSISTPLSMPSRPVSAMRGQKFRPPSSSATSPNIGANNHHTIVSIPINFSLDNGLWALFGVHGGRKTLELGQIYSDNSEIEFLRKLRETYRELRGFRRVWFSFWQFSHCDFVKVIRPFSSSYVFF